LFVLALAASAGILLADWLGGSLWWWLVGAVLLMVAAVVRGSAGLTILATAVVFGFAQLAADWDPLRQRLASELAPGMSMGVEFRGLVVDAPELAVSGGWILPLELEAIEAAGRGRWVVRRERVSVRLSAVPTAPCYGDRVAGFGQLRRPAEPRNPGEFDFASYLRRLGFSGELEVDGRIGRWERQSAGHGSWLMVSALRMRSWIGEAVTFDIGDDPERAATVRAMVLGTREKTPEEVEAAFVRSGTMHVFAVSGLHVGMFTVILWNVLRWFGLRRGLVVALTLPLVFFYVYITGLRASAWRAALMAAVFLAGPLWNREGNLLNGLGAAALVLLGVQPCYLFQPGFTLSFGVLLALAVLHRPVLRLLAPLHEPDPFLPEELFTGRQEAWWWFRRRIAESLSLSVASTLGSAPLMIGYFRMVTPVGVVANLLLVVLSLCILVVACMAMVAAALHWPLLTASLNHANWLLAVGSIESAKFFASVPGGHFRVDPARLWRGEVCEVTILALDQGGSAIHVDTPSGKHWLIDCGGRRHFRKTLQPHLERAAVNRLTGMVLTHGDSDHTGAAGLMSSVFGVGRIVGGEAGEPLVTGSSRELDHGVVLRVLFPPPGWEAGVADDRCAVLLLEAYGVRVLLMGDAGFPTEKHLSEAGADLRSDVLVKGWHGSDYSGLPETLDASGARVAVVHRGHFPSSEQPPPEWPRRLGERGVREVDQARSGAVTIRLQPGGASVNGFVDGSRVEVVRARSGAAVR
jgi:ComEC/Rec2-related protein